ncbi:hypothetical protein [Amphritea balenae]|uniref:YtkA-like domain-containing protein n=1 Tax=Amphritea balenae TaxID=452629 RepID=A0A3P1STG9_9GAMM|nr:hypothetical protein [Amphritea balenae]RRD00370.1 hypothetical protein EHS89_04545 [Amphritea balenae]GGK86013.1 hypothetical protein GCM10007941_40660 [Amphritea balenae]
MPQTEQSSNKKQYLIIAILGVFILAIWLGSSALSLPENKSTGVSVKSDCDLKKESCKVEINDLSMTVDVLPRNINSMTPMSYTVKIEGVESESVMIDLQGTEMFMGLNQTQLTAVPGQPGLFKGTGELGACTTGEMGWRATIVAVTEDGPVKTWFDFRAK